MPHLNPDHPRVTDSHKAVRSVQLSEKVMKYGYTASYLTRQGEPWLPVMGECHFSRLPVEQWDTAIMHMQQGGIDILSTYVFWIHHEEIEGLFDWDGRRDLRRFLTICHEKHMPVWLRIGPWAHGECRNGGFPDWLMAKETQEGWPLRTNDRRYLERVQVFLNEIHKQAEGFFQKDGGPIIGIQLENEYGHCGGLQDQPGVDHLCTLKGMALEAGFDVPYWSATAWGQATIIPGETLPVWGGYPEAPWARNIDPLPPSAEFVFGQTFDETPLGADPAQVPYLTAELGPGVQVTAHRRPLIDPWDAYAMAICRLGSGANLIGYYMYHGGINPDGRKSTLQESQSTGMPNDVPEKNYDFQAPLGSYSQERPHYRKLRLLHHLIHEFGSRLARLPWQAHLTTGSDPRDDREPRSSVRSDGQGGFLFVNHHQHGYPLQDIPGWQPVVTTNRSWRFPAMDLVGSAAAVLPFGLEMGGLSLVTTSLQPLFDLPDELVCFMPFQTGQITLNQARIISMDGFRVTETDEVNQTITLAVDSCPARAIIQVAAGLRRLNVLSEKEALDAVRIGATCRIDPPPVILLQNPVSVESRPDEWIDLDLGGKQSAHLFKVFALDLPETPEQATDGWLTLPFEGNMARLYHDGHFMDDWFWYGRDWMVRLPVDPEKTTGEWLLKIKPWQADDRVYLERQPQAACDPGRIMATWLN